MIKKIKDYFAKRKQSKSQLAELKRTKKYYEVLRNGYAFIQFVKQDLNKTKDTMNRHQRRRLEKTILKGEFTEELVNHYKNYIDKVLNEVNKKLVSKTK